MYENLLMVKDGVASRTPVPESIYGLPPEILLDLTWVDPALGLYDTQWWPSKFVDGELGRDFKWGDESYHLDYENHIVEITREQIPLTQEEKDERRARELAYMSPIIDAERDRRTAMGFVYDGKAYQTENQSQIDDILGKMTDSLAAITIDQAQPGDLRWASPEYDFAWSTADGTLVPMDAQTCLAFTRSAVRRKTLLVGAGLALKAMDPIPADYIDDKYWPPLDSTAKTTRK
ncbi:hypothetical protein V6W80_11565 [Pseudomonas benzopyrenica]|uniref:DUF4376 domain-containing protein n=1 Tax=Pseudomonas benzopyrenica TaxID=2993566 RepID=A0ABZ2FX36_9PSED